MLVKDSKSLTQDLHKECNQVSLNVGHFFPFGKSTPKVFTITNFTSMLTRRTFVMKKSTRFENSESNPKRCSFLGLKKLKR